MTLSRGKFWFVGLLFICLSVFRGADRFADSGEAFAGQTLIENVRIDTGVLTPGEQAGISFFLTEDAEVSVFVYSPDFVPVRTLMNQQRRILGSVSVTWDGTDDSGVAVPDEAYLIGIVAEDSGGRRSVYDPTAFSGGEILDLKMARVEVSDEGVYTLYYSLDESARVSIRAGIHQGPLLRTLLDWEPHLPGEYILTWDGMDDAGVVRVMDVRGALLDIRGFSLPEGTLLVQGHGGDYSSYHRSFRHFEATGDRLSRRFPARVPDAESYDRAPAVSSEMLSYSRFRQNVIKRRGERISPQYVVPRILNVSPDFKVYFQHDTNTPLARRSTVDVSGTVGIVIEVSPESLASFNESRYEIIIFIGHRRVDEEEQAYSPYTYLLDTSRLENGEHVISINLASITGQVSSYSFKLNVVN